MYGLIIGTVALYYFSLIVNQVYSKKICQFEKIEVITLLAIFIIGALILWLVKNSILWVMICLLIWNFAFLLVFLMKSKNSLN